ncbi:carbohydrate binding domain-containing protein [Chloroflexota bacterium]
MILPFLKNLKQSKNLVIGIVTCLVIVGVYNLLFFDRYLPIVEGWGSVYADYILEGAVPYRDFHYFLPPVYPFIITAFTYIFGVGIILLRIFGIVVILAMTTVLFLIYARFFPVYIACIAAIVSILYYQSDNTHITYDFLHFCNLFGLLGVFFIFKHFDYDVHSLSTKSWKPSALLFCAGLFGALAFLTKQSNGGLLVIFSFVAVAISTWSKEGFRKALESMGIYAFGVVVPILAVFIWLISNGALLAFWEQVFIGASSSKGGLLSILFAWVPRNFASQYFPGLLIFIVAISLAKIWFYQEGFMLDGLVDKDNRKFSPPSLKIPFIFLGVLILFMLCILLPFWNIGLSQALDNNSFLKRIYSILDINLITVSLLLFCFSLFKLYGTKKAQFADIFIITTISLGFMWGCGSGAFVRESGTFLALGLMLGYLFNIGSSVNRGRIFALILVFCAFLIIYMAPHKYLEPFNWWGLDEPDVRAVSTPLQSKYLHGFNVSNQKARIYSEVTSIVERYTKPGDHIYTFPNIPTFYLLTDRYPNTFGLVSWFDVESDKFAENDAYRILESPPEVIIYLDIPEFVWKGHEVLFRDGKECGQRKIKESIRYLTSTGDYKIEAVYEVPDGYNLIVWRKLLGNISDSVTENGTDNQFRVSNNNLIANGNFENGDHPTGWVAEHSVKARESTIVRSGAYSIRITASSSIYGNAYQRLAPYRNLLGREVTVGVWLYAPSTNTAVESCISLKSKLDNSDVVTSAVIPKDDAWHWVTVTLKVSDTADVLQFSILANQGTSTSDVVYADDAIFAEGDTVVPLTFPLN